MRHNQTCSLSRKGSESRRTNKTLPFHLEADGFEQITLSQRLQLFAVRYQIRVSVLLYKSIDQFLKSSDALQIHVPCMCEAIQTILETVDKQRFILLVSCHLPELRDQVHFRASISCVLLKGWHFKLRRYHHVSKQAEIIHIMTEHFFTTDTLQLFLHRIILFFQVSHPIITRHTIGVVNLFFLLLSSMNEGSSIDHSSLRKRLTRLIK